VAWDGVGVGEDEAADDSSERGAGGAVGFGGSECDGAQARRRRESEARGFEDEAGEGAREEESSSGGVALPGMDATDAGGVDDGGGEGGEGEDDVGGLEVAVEEVGVDEAACEEAEGVGEAEVMVGEGERGGGEVVEEGFAGDSAGDEGVDDAASLVGVVEEEERIGDGEAA